MRHVLIENNAPIRVWRQGRGNILRWEVPRPSFLYGSVAFGAFVENMAGGCLRIVRLRSRNETNTLDIESTKWRILCVPSSSDVLIY